MYIPSFAKALLLCLCGSAKRQCSPGYIPGNEFEADFSFPNEHKPLVNHPTASEVTLNDHAEDDGYADQMKAAGTKDSSNYIR